MSLGSYVGERVLADGLGERNPVAHHGGLHGTLRGLVDERETKRCTPLMPDPVVDYTTQGRNEDCQRDDDEQCQPAEGCPAAPPGGEPYPGVQPADDDADPGSRLIE